MSASLFSVLNQSSASSDWNWLLIFIIFVIVLTIALIVQTRFSKQEAADLEHHAGEAHHEETELAPETGVETDAISAPEESEIMLNAEAVPSGGLDDLKRIEGIGPKVANLLNERGITTFSQLAEIPVEKLTEILEANKLQMMNPVSWPKQAQLAAAGDWETLEKLQGDLKGGR